MQYNEIVAKLRYQLEIITQQSADIDAHNKKSKSVHSREIVFDPNLFRCRSEKLSDYAREISQSIDKLERIIVSNNQEYIAHYSESLNNQLSALVQAIKANEVNLKSTQLDKRVRQASYQKRFKQAAKTVMQSSHELYSELAKHHEFERRLAEMIEMRNMALKSAIGENSKSLQEEILALHQRLGRCRQAISKIEGNIARVEKTRQ